MIEGLLKAYDRAVRLPWTRDLAGPQKVWFAIYDPAEERRLRFRLPEFETATKQAGRRWHELDLTDSFARWLTNHEYREEYWSHPDDLEQTLSEFDDDVVARVSEVLAGPDANEKTVVAVFGAASLFGFSRLSALVDRVAPRVRGRLLVFFPGQRDGSNYRFLGARDGWNYQATPIEAAEGG